jgi:hypothetical protein
MQFINIHFCKSTMSIFLAILIFLYIHYWRRNRDEIVPINWPIIGILPALLRHLSNFHDHTTFVLKHRGGTFRFQGAWFTNTGFIGTSDPMNVNHIASKNFGNYGRGSNFQDIFYFFRGSILNSNSHVWKQRGQCLLHISKGKPS